MTALAQQLCDDGLYPNVTAADAAITNGQVYKDDNGQIRCAGSPRPVVAGVDAAGQVASVTLNAGGATKHRGGSTNSKW